MKYLKSFNEGINNEDIEDNLLELEDIGYTYELVSGYSTKEADGSLDFDSEMTNNTYFIPSTKVIIQSSSIFNSLDISLDELKKRFDVIHSVLTRIQSRIGNIHIWEFTFNSIVFIVLSGHED